MEVTSGDHGRALSRRSADRESLRRIRSGMSRESGPPRRPPGSEAPCSGPQPRSSLSRRAQDLCDAKDSCILEPWPCRRHYRRCGPAECLRLFGTFLLIDRPEYRLPAGGADDGERVLTHCGQLSFDGAVEEFDDCEFEDEVLDREAIPHLPQLHEPDGFDHAAILDVLDMHVKVCLEPLLFASRTVQ